MDCNCGMGVIIDRSDSIRGSVKLQLSSFPGPVAYLLKRDRHRSVKTMMPTT